MMTYIKMHILLDRIQINPNSAALGFEESEWLPDRKEIVLFSQLVLLV